MNELDGERAELNPRSGFHLVKLRFIRQPVLFQPPLHQRQREGRAVNRNVDLAQQKRHRADVIFMAVRQDQCADLVAMLLQIREIGRDDVHAQQFRIGKHHAGVDDDDVVPVADGHRIHTELAQAAERDQLKLVIRHVRFRLSVESSTVAGCRWLVAGCRWLVVSRPCEYVYAPARQQAAKAPIRRHHRAQELQPEQK